MEFSGIRVSLRDIARKEQALLSRIEYLTRVHGFAVVSSKFAKDIIERNEDITHDYKLLHEILKLEIDRRWREVNET